MRAARHRGEQRLKPGGVRIETALARHARYSAATKVIPAPTETKSAMREPASRADSSAIAGAAAWA